MLLIQAIHHENDHRMQICSTFGALGPSSTAGPTAFAAARRRRPERRLWGAAFDVGKVRSRDSRVRSYGDRSCRPTRSCGWPSASPSAPIASRCSNGGAASQRVALVETPSYDVASRRGSTPPHLERGGREARSVQNELRGLGRVGFRARGRRPHEEAGHERTHLTAAVPRDRLAGRAG